jgi:hypothetical protein
LGNYFADNNTVTHFKIAHYFSHIFVVLTPLVRHRYHAEESCFLFQFHSNGNDDSSDDNDDDDEEDEAAAPRRKNPDEASEAAKPPILGPDPTLPAETGRRKPRRPRTVFHKALDALQMDWEDGQLKDILRSRIGALSESLRPFIEVTGLKISHHKLCVKAMTNCNVEKYFCLSVYIGIFQFVMW